MLVSFLASLIRLRALSPLLFSILVYNTEAYQTKGSLGINIAELSYWSTEWFSVDAFKLANDEWLTQCRGWGDAACKPPSPASPWNTQEQAVLNVDENGWVKSLPDENDDNIY
ncbi:hypothetical protein [Spartinivicinus ruber]|uniref:hypothetical protein n=1 Tax=Spartinivicinus ruber TaxID=2683272 RepID=UPI0013D06ADB|nr:hypothetical protein [Spartinivicinus ruber]